MFAHTIIGYTYDAATHCDACAAERFGRCPCEQRDVHGQDSEDNEVLPIYAMEEHPENVYCDDCGDIIYEAEHADGQREDHGAREAGGGSDGEGYGSHAEAQEV